MKTYLSRILVILLTLFFFECQAQVLPQIKIQSEDVNILVGEWTGSLTYVDYRSDKPFTMPANLKVKRGKKQNKILLWNIYPNEPKANNLDKIIISKDGKRLNGRKITEIKRPSTGELEIWIEFEGKDNNKKASIRNIYILSKNKFIIKKEVRLEKSIPWTLRNEFSYSRQ